ncbi:MAG: hypothetical protein J5793_05510 [Clostridia bacterium]|nr:hypothetical protein [Clostridia bacterium]
MKKALCILLALAAAVSLFACGSGSNDNTSEAAQSADDVSQPEETEPEPEKSPYLDGKKLVVFGDSITALGSWGRTAAENLNMYFFNGAMGGITSAQGIVRFPAYVASRDADYVTLLFGMNDLIMVSEGVPRATPEVFEDNLRTLVQMVRDCGAEPILLTANPLDPNKFWAAQGQSRTMYESVGGDPLAWEEVYNDVTRKVAKETGTYLVDMFKACEGVPYTELLYDGIHLAAKGNQIFADTLTEWFNNNFEHDPNAEKISDDGNKRAVTADSGKVNLYSTDPSGWYTVDPSLMAITCSDGELRLMNTNGLWPFAESLPETPLEISVDDGYLYYDISTGNVNASILLFFGNSTPSAYTEGTYLSINGVIGAKCNEVGDVMPNQRLKGKLKLSDIGIPAKNITGGKVTITGVKVFVSGTAYQYVIIRDLSVGIE